MIKDKSTYEILKPESVGFNETKLVLGKLSGRNALKKRYEELGYVVTDEQLKEIFKNFKDLTDRKKEIFDEDIIALLETQPTKGTNASYTFKDLSLQILGENQYRAFVHIVGSDESIIEGVGEGNGPIDAIYKGIDSALTLDVELIDYKINSISKGKDSIGEVFVKVRNNESMVQGRAINVDIIVASANAYIDAINRLKSANPNFLKI